MSQRECCHLLYVVCSGGRAVAHITFARRRKLARHSQISHENNEHQAWRFGRDFHCYSAQGGAQRTGVLSRQRSHSQVILNYVF
jgi:hypothetical protein